MRQAWRHAMPALTREYGLKPWDVERLTFAELETYREDLVKKSDARREAAVKAKRRRVG